MFDLFKGLFARRMDKSLNEYSLVLYIDGDYRRTVRSITDEWVRKMLIFNIRGNVDVDSQSQLANSVKLWLCAESNSAYIQ